MNMVITLGINMVKTLATNILKTPVHDHGNKLRHEYLINPNH